MRLAFIIPFRSPQSARNFEKCERELRRTVAQAQRAGGGDCVFVGASAGSKTESGSGAYGASVVVTAMGAPEPSSRRELLLDKAVKRYLAIHEALEHNDYDLFAMLDADDLVSTKYVDVVRTVDTDDSGGVVIDAAYVFDLGDEKLQVKYGINSYCGSTLIYTSSFLMNVGLLRAEAEERYSTYAEVISNVDNDLLIDLLGEHCDSRTITRRLGFPLKLINQPIVTWLVHNENNVSLTKLPSGSLPVDQAFLNEFGLLEVTPRRVSLLENLLALLRQTKSRIGQFLRRVTTA